MAARKPSAPAAPPSLLTPAGRKSARAAVIRNASWRDPGFVTPENITFLLDDEVFVFGSNEAGRHGAGAAKTAARLFGAMYGVGYGLAGDSFAIPTKDAKLGLLPLPEVGLYVRRFLEQAYRWDAGNHRSFWLVTAIGTGLAGRSHQEMAELFRDGLRELSLVWNPDDIRARFSFPEPWWPVIFESSP